MNDEMNAAPEVKAMSPKKLGLIIVGILAVGVIGASANRYFAVRSIENSIEAATGGRVNVDSDGGDVTIKTDDGTWTSSDDSLPKDFPNDVPVYPGASIQGSIGTTSGSEGNGNYVGLESTDAFAVVVAWYQKEVAEKGWSIVSNLNVDNVVSLSASKDNRTLVVSITKDADSGKVGVGLFVSQK